MHYDNNATRIRREVLIRIAQAWFDGCLVESVDRVPLQMRPRGGGAARCCVHKDRAVLKYRIMAALGMRVEDEEDELTPLAEYARRALQRQDPDGPILTVLDEACSGCVRTHYSVTNACRGCMARPCMLNCPKDAIRMVKGHAEIDEARCVNCGKCQQVCPYSAIVRVPVPCEEVCPVGAIAKDETGKETIDYDKCIYCGKCMAACPFGAVMERSQAVDVLRTLDQPRPAVALVAPSIVGQFPGELAQLVTGLKRLGFDAVHEVAAGAVETAVQEAAELHERLESGDHMMTTSCCPAWMRAVEAHLPEAAPLASDTPTPMHYAGLRARRRHPEAVIVFIGPCVAKRHEAMDDPTVDYVLTFEELGALFVAADVDTDVCPPDETVPEAAAEGRGFAVSGGVTEAIRSAAGGAGVRAEAVDGLDRKSMRRIRKLARGKGPCNFLEVMSCEGGCVAGPGALANPRMSARAVGKLVDQSPSELSRKREPAHATGTEA